MKTVFEASDIKSLYNSWVIKNRPWKKDLQYAATIVYKIGYIAGAQDDEKPLCLISALTDGMVIRCSEEQFLSILNGDEGHNILTDKQLLEIVRGNMA